jgi:hypothetical protein
LKRGTYGRFGLRITCAAQAEHVAPTMKVAPRPASLGLSMTLRFIKV